MTKIFFVRHGKTEWNLEGRYQGAHGDSPLLPQSYDEIKQLAAFLKQYHFEHIYCSPIKRAHTTATTLQQALGQADLAVTPEPAFQEFDLGVMEGMKFCDVGAKYPEQLDAFRNHPDKYDAASLKAESFEHLFARMTPAVKELVAKHPTGNVIVVSHGAALCAEIRHLLGYSLKDLRAAGGLANTSTTILQSTDGVNFECLKWNDTEYLSRKLDATDIV